jgi:hypothetical protein
MYIFFISALLLIIIWIHIYRLDNMISPPSPSNSVSITYYTAADPAIFSSYINDMNTINIYARGFTDLATLRTHYTATASTSTPILNDFTRLEKDTISAAVASFLSHRSTSERAWLSDLITFSALAHSTPHLEQGYPHTHSHVIFMPHFNLGTYLHELAHIHQRAYPHVWTRLLEVWGFQHIPDLMQRADQHVCDIIGRNRLNPDGRDVDYIWRDPVSRKLYWFGAVFTSEYPATLADVEYIACEMDGEYRFINSIPIASCPGLRAYFSIAHNHYHPYEIMAEYFVHYWFGKHIAAPGYRAFTDYIAQKLFSG